MNQTCKHKPILHYRFDIQDNLKNLSNETTIFPYIFQWSGAGKKVKKVRVLCNEDRAVYVDIEYIDESEKWKI